VIDSATNHTADHRDAPLLRLEHVDKRFQMGEVVVNDDFAEVTEGLSEGESVVLTPESTLSDGQRVSAVVQTRAEPEATPVSDPLQTDGD